MPRTSTITLSACLMLMLGAGVSSPAQKPGPGPATDPLRDMQNEYAANKTDKMTRAYHFGSQGPGDVYSNHTSHSNRLIPFYTFGKKVDIGAVTGKNSRYRDAEKIKALYGTLPPNTLNPEADYADQSDLYHVQKAAADRGAKYLFTVWFDGLDWDTTRAAAAYKSGKIYHEGKGTGLVFQDETADGSAQFGYYVTAPTHDKSAVNFDEQTVKISPESLTGGYDAQVAGPNPWTRGPRFASGYFKGQSGNDEDKAGVAAVGRLMHAYTDSAQSAAEYISGVKSYNGSVNVTDDGRCVPTLLHELQARGWKVGTTTSVPFNHVSPAAMYAHNVNRSDYQDIARDMLGLSGITQKTGKETVHPGLDVVIGCGHGRNVAADAKKSQGENEVLGGNKYITSADLAAVDVKNGGKYVVSQTTPGVNGAVALAEAARKAAKGGHRLLGFYGTKTDHLPLRTADGKYDPAKGIKGTAEKYEPSDLIENPTLADMTRAALTAISAQKGQPFYLFVEAGDVDYGLHDNNLDAAIGALYSGEAAVQAIIDWVRENSNWDESALIVSADHGHYLVVDDIQAIADAGKAARASAPASPSR